MTEKPVYLAGRGFQDDKGPPPSRWRWPLLAFLLLLGVGALLFLRREVPEGHCRLLVRSTPPGAEILLDLNAAHGVTPATVDWPRDRDVLVQVRLPGFESQPLAYRLSRRELAAEERVLEFNLVALPTGVVKASSTPGAAGGDSLPPLIAHSTTSTARPLAPAVSQVAAPAPPPGGHTLAWVHWDPSYRLRLDGRIQPGPTQVMAPGSHRLQVDLRGRTLLDTLVKESGPHRLVLPGAERFVEVRIQPQEAEIVQGDATLGKGRALIHRGDLPLVLRFPALPGLLPPASLTLVPSSPGRVDVRHSQSLDLRWTPNESKGLNALDMGYEMDGRYQPDPDHGPRRQGGSLLLGRAFHDRRPGGAQALRLGFDAPEGLNRQWEARLEIHAVDSGKRHPLTLGRGATLTVWVNGTALVKDMPLVMDEAPRSWPVSSLLKPGRNEVRIQSSEASRSSTALLSVALKVGP